MALKVWLAQMDLRVGDIAGNVRQILAEAHHARDRYGADLALFPELSLTGYPPEDLLLRPDFLRTVEEGLETLRREARDIALLVGYPRPWQGRLFNAAGVIHQGHFLTEYHKQHLPNYGVFDEKRYFQAGQDPCVFELGGVPLGITICEDIWQAGPARQARDAGARCLLNLNASPFHAGKQREREALVYKRVKDLGIPLVYLNLVGGQDELVFDGGSFAMDAGGQTRARLPAFEAAGGLVEVAADGGIRADAPLEPIAEDDAAIYEALVLGVRDYVTKNRFKGAVLGLSGGIDSALTLALAVDALGADRVEAVLMPSRYTADMSVEDARAEADALGVRHRLIPIEPAFETFLEMLSGEFAGLPRDATEENIQARIRGIILMAISNKFGRILLTTGNKSEMAVGYATLYGDMAGGFAPLKDVPKTLVYRLARYRNQRAPVIPERVLERPPSAELAPDQKDEDSLPPYEILDPILQRYIELDQGVEEIAVAGFDLETVRRVAHMVDRNEYKRRQAPPGVRISRRAFGRDRRYPITNGFG